MNNGVKIVRKGDGFLVEWLRYHPSFRVTDREAAKFAREFKKLLADYSAAVSEGCHAYAIDGLSSGRLHLTIRDEDAAGDPIVPDEGPKFILGIAQLAF